MNRYQSEWSVFNRMLRVCWGLGWFLFFRPSPRIAHRWRIALLKLFGAKVHASAVVYPSVRVWAPWNLVMEEGAALGDRVDCYSVGTVTLRAGAMVSQDSCLCSATHDYESEAFTLQVRPIEIGPKAWVAARAFIGPGVSVGEGAVVAAGAVVVKNVSPWTVVGGNPAVPIKKRQLNPNQPPSRPSCST